MTPAVSNDVQKILRLTSDIDVSSLEDKISKEVFFIDISSHGSPLNCGFAESFVEGLALHKAYSEYVERRVFEALTKSLGLKTTSGMAAHPDHAAAMENAILELIERDAFLMCWLGKRPPLWLLNEDISVLAGRAQACLEGIREHQMEPRIGLVAMTGDVFTVCGALMGAKFASPFGFIVATAAEKSLASCVEKTVLTLARYANVFVTRAGLGLPLVDSSQAGNRDPVDIHLKKSLDFDAFSQCSWFFESSVEVLVLPTFEVSCEELVVDFPLAFPRSVALANAPDAQPFFFGETTTNLVNRGRIRSVFGGDGILNYQVHPLL